MGIAVRRKNHQIGQSSYFLNIPKPIPVGRESTIAVNRLILADPPAEIPEGGLLEFMEERVEPAFWGWYRHKRER